MSRFDAEVKATRARMTAVQNLISTIRAHPGHDQKSHGRKGGGATGQAALDAAPAAFTPGPHAHAARGDVSGATLVGPPGAGAVESLAEYEGRAYDRINGVLRAESETRPLERIASEETRGHIAEIDQTMEVSRLTSDVQVDRVVMDGPAVFGSDWYSHGLEPITSMDQVQAASERWAAGERPDLTGLSWREAGYTSTSADPRVPLAIGDARLARGTQLSEHGTEPVIMTVSVPRGTGAVQLSHLSGGDRPTSEAELLLERGLTMTVTADHGIDENGYRRLDVEASRG